MDGDADGRYQVSLDTWNVKAYKIPFNMLSQSGDLSKISTAGVYFLFGYEGNQKAVYVGEAEDVYRRLTQHTPSHDKFVWENCVVFVSTDLGVFDKARIKYLENRLYNLIKNASSYILWNKNEPTKSRISLPAEDAMETVIDNIQLVIPVLGYSPFKKRTEHSKEPYTVTEPETSGMLFYIKAKGIKATCRLNQDGQLFLLAGSQIYETEAKTLNQSNKKKRQDLFKSKKVKNGILQENTKCDSASQLASVVLGAQKDGLLTLKTADGQTLREYLNNHK